MSTKSRAIEVASTMFGERGVAGTSLDDVAGEMGVTKQTILYHFGSKGALVSETLVAGANELLETLDRAASQTGESWDRVDAVVRAAFALAVRQPHLIGLLRELSRLDESMADSVLDVLGPAAERAVGFMEDRMAAGQFRAADPRLVLITAYSLVTGVVSDQFAISAVGLELDLRVAVALRGSVLDLLRSSLLIEA